MTAAVGVSFHSVWGGLGTVRWFVADSPDVPSGGSLTGGESLCLLVRVSGAYMTFGMGNCGTTRTSRRVETQLTLLERHIAMRRIAAVILGTAALLGALATPAIADPDSSAVGGAAASAAATAQNLITGVEATVDNLTGGL